MNTKPIDSYINQHILLSALKQKIFNNEFESMEWGYDTQTGILTFNNSINFNAEILGSFSTGSKTWLWSWANSQSGLPHSITRVSKQLSEWGKQKGVIQFSDPEIKVSKENNPIMFSLLSIGLCQLPAYFIGNHGGGFVSLIILNKDQFSIPNLPSTGLINHIMETISQYEIKSHKDAVIGMCKGLRWKGETNGNIISVINPADNKIILIEFDDLNRIKSIKS